MRVSWTLHDEYEVIGSGKPGGADVFTYYWLAENHSYKAIGMKSAQIYNWWEDLEWQKQYDPRIPYNNGSARTRGVCWWSILKPQNRQRECPLHADCLFLCASHGPFRSATQPQGVEIIHMQYKLSKFEANIRWEAQDNRAPLSF